MNLSQRVGAESTNRDWGYSSSNPNPVSNFIILIHHHSHIALIHHRSCIALIHHHSHIALIHHHSHITLIHHCNCIILIHHHSHICHLVARSSQNELLSNSSYFVIFICFICVSLEPIKVRLRSYEGWASSNSLPIGCLGWSKSDPLMTPCQTIVSNQDIIHSISYWDVPELVAWAP